MIDRRVNAISSQSDPVQPRQVVYTVLNSDLNSRIWFGFSPKLRYKVFVCVVLVLVQPVTGKKHCLSGQQAGQPLRNLVSTHCSRVSARSVLCLRLYSDECPQLGYGVW